MNTRDPLQLRAINASNEHVGQFFSVLDLCRPQPGATCSFHGMVDGLVWSDEYPTGIEENHAIFNNIFCVLIHLRTSIILGTDLTEEELTFLSKTKSGCPNWAFFSEDRFKTSLRKEYDIQKKRFANELDDIFGEKPGTHNVG